jgi:hypothetical protein
MLRQRSFSIICGAGLLPVFVLVACSFSGDEPQVGEALETEVASLEPVAPATARPIAPSSEAASQPATVATGAGGRPAPATAPDRQPPSRGSAVQAGHSRQGPDPAGPGRRVTSDSTGGVVAPVARPEGLLWGWVAVRAWNYWIFQWNLNAAYPPLFSQIELI